MEEANYIIKYSFSNYLNNYPLGEDPREFINEIDFEVFLKNESGLQEKAAKGKIFHILFSLAMDLKFPLFDVMDANSSVSDMASILFDWEVNKDYWDKLDIYFESYPLENYNVCFLETLEIISKYRGNGLGEKIINILIERFYSSCGLWVLKVYPLQFDVITIKENQIEWKTKMDYLTLEKDFEKAQYKLFNHFTKMGFQNPFEMEYFITKTFDYISKNKKG